jgi:hypothetical protein
MRLSQWPISRYRLCLRCSRRSDRTYKYTWVFWSFALFILACGMTHVMSIWTLWVPDYALEGLVKSGNSNRFYFYGYRFVYRACLQTA